jgi:hypothetical protein
VLVLPEVRSPPALLALRFARPRCRPWNRHARSAPTEPLRVVGSRRIGLRTARSTGRKA